MMAFVSITAYLVLCGSAAARLLITGRKLLLVVYRWVCWLFNADVSTYIYLYRAQQECTLHVDPGRRVIRVLDQCRPGSTIFVCTANVNATYIVHGTVSHVAGVDGKRRRASLTGQQFGNDRIDCRLELGFSRVRVCSRQLASHSRMRRPRPIRLRRPTSPHAFPAGSSPWKADKGFMVEGAGKRDHHSGPRKGPVSISVIGFARPKEYLEDQKQKTVDPDRRSSPVTMELGDKISGVSRRSAS